MNTIQSTHESHEGRIVGRPHIRPAVLDAREKLIAGREKLRRQHEAGTVGIQVSNKLTTLFDEVVVSLFDGILADFDDELADRFRETRPRIPIST